MKTNCWEFMKCGHEPKESSPLKFKSCPIFMEKTLNGVHGGKNAGRACWVIAGTKCGGITQGLFASKLGKCVMCDFYKKVRSEEEDFYIPSQLIDIVITGYSEA